jgi:hypothetical protein
VDLKAIAPSLKAEREVLEVNENGQRSVAVVHGILRVVGG